MDRSDSYSLAPLQPNHPKSDRLLGPEQHALESTCRIQIGTQPLSRRTQRDTDSTTYGLIGRNIEIAVRRKNAGA